MTMNEFLDHIRSLHCIDGWLLPELSLSHQERFVADPVRYFIQADDEEAAAIWREVKRRQQEAERNAA